MQEAEEVTFGEPYYADQFTGNKHQKVLKTDKFFYIPLCDTLRRLMYYQAEVLNPHTNNECLRDFCDGSFFKSHPLFSYDPYALQIVGYYDDLEIVNPLGSYIKKHKLGCLFFSLGNVRPQLRSTLKTIQLLAVGRTQDIQYYGINAFLRPFVEDLKQLYCNGISVSIGGESRIFHGGLIAFLADTLAAHLLGGFKGSMSFALRVCRSCMITSEQLQQCYSESTCGMRTSDSCFEQCSLLCGPLKDHYSKIYGINYLSVLEEVPGYSIIGGLPHDIMHDLYEGIVPYEMKLLLCHCVSQRYFTIDELNERMDRYGFTDNQPRPIDPSVIRNCESKIRQSASQMMTLSQHLPLLIGDRIPNDDIHWSSFLLLLKICCIANSPTFSPDTIQYFRILIEEKLLAFKELYPHEKLLPKHHYMVHYPSQIERLGPLVSSWTMRYESKLSFVKRVSHQSNFKNVCKTIAKKHQLWMCYQLLKEPHLLTPSLTFSPKFKSSPLISEDACVQSECFRLIPSLPLDYEITHPEWVRIQSSMLRHGTYIMTMFDIDRPLFGRIIDIIRVEDSTVIVYVQVYVGELFISHYNAFLIKPTGEFSVFNMCTLHDYRPVTVKSSFVQSDRELYVLLPYYY